MRFFVLLLLTATSIWAVEPPKNPVLAKLKAVDEKVDAEVKSLVDIYKDFHQFPELSLKEERSAAKMAKEIKALGFDVTEKVGGTGVVAVLKNGIRITALSLLSIYVNPSFLAGRLHTDGGVVFFLISLGILAPVLLLLRRLERQRPRQAVLA